jgi:hypothetical protein
MGRSDERQKSGQGVSEGLAGLVTRQGPNGGGTEGSAGWAGRAEVKPAVAAGPNLREGLAGSKQERHGNN